MRTILFCLFLLSAAGPVSAQHFSIGASAGADLWLNRATYTQDKQALAPGANVFLQYQGKSKWRFGLDVGIHGRYDQDEYSLVGFDGNVYVQEEFRARLYTASLQLQRLLSSHKPQKVEHFAGLNAGLAIFDRGLTGYADSWTLNGGRKQSVIHGGEALPVRFWSGFQYQLNYNFHPNWSACVLAAAEADISRLFGEEFPPTGYNAPYGRCNFSIGIAYRMN